MRKVTLHFNSFTPTLGVLNEKMCNCGIYNMTVGTLIQFVPLIQNNNAAGEYYLTDLVEIAIRNGVVVNYYLLPVDKHLEIVNINTREDLDNVNKICF